jgi:hypothetical protein
MRRRALFAVLGILSVPLAAEREGRDPQLERALDTAADLLRDR